MVGCLSRVGLSSTPGDWFQFSFYFVTWLQLLIFSVFPRTSGSSIGTFLVAEGGRLSTVWLYKGLNPVTRRHGEESHYHSPPYSGSACPAGSMAPSQPHYVDSESARNAREPGGEGSSLCGVLCLPVGHSGPDFGRVLKCSVVADAHGLARSRRQGGDPARVCARLPSPGSGASSRLGPTSSPGRYRQGRVLEPSPGSSRLFALTFTPGWESRI